MENVVVNVVHLNCKMKPKNSEHLHIVIPRLWLGTFMWRRRCRVSWNSTCHSVLCNRMWWWFKCLLQKGLDIETLCYRQTDPDEQVDFHMKDSIIHRDCLIKATP